MFRHQGKTRTLSHNLRIASLLSFVAGIVNVTGVLAVGRLTTNVTGHFAYLIDEVFKLNYSLALEFFLYILFFFLGSFCSGFIVEFISRKSERFIFVAPVVIEIVILLAIPVFSEELIFHHPDILACALLFAMGLQNSLVTSISNAVVRTTHLTGLFTDLGIELSQLFFYKAHDQRKKLFSSIRLRVTIIFCFFLGGLSGGIFYPYFHLRLLSIAAACLLAGLIYDYVKFKLISIKRKLSSKKNSSYNASGD